MANGSVWVTGDVITTARMNLKTILTDTGAAINSATAVEGQIAYCNSTGSGFTQGITYQYNGSVWGVFGSSATLQVADVYSITIGDYTTPTSATASSGSNTQLANTGYVASFTGAWNGAVFATKLTGLTPGAPFNAVEMKISTSAGNIRVKVYADDGAAGDPSTLLGESSSVAAVGSAGAIQIILLTSSAVVPASGNVWCAFECDSASLSIYYTGGLANGITKYILHTFGAGPSPFGTVTNTTSGIYFGLDNRTAAANVVDGDTTTKWQSNSETHPYVYADMGSALLLSGCAIHWDGINTTATQILVQTSPDATTWTTVRTINTNLFTNGAWSYFRWNLPNTVLPRYVRFYGNDGTAKVLAIWEIKIKKYTNDTTGAFTFMQVHGHPSISSTVATTSLAA